MRKIAITRSEFYHQEPRLAVMLLENGFDRLHIRKPNATAEQISALIRAIPSGYYSRIVLHDHFELSVKFGLGGVHINSRNGVVPNDFKGTVSCSCHTLEQVEQCKERCDYLFLSPIFDSISKEGYHSAFSYNQLLEARNSGVIDEKVYALGGVCDDNMPIVEELGFGGVAMIGSAWSRTITPPVVMTIAGSDSSGGAGIQADIKAISALGGFAASAITAVTAQNTMAVTAIHPLPIQMVEQQMVAVLDDLDVAAVKIGMVHNSEVVEAIAKTIERYGLSSRVVCDPVMVATSGAKLITDQTINQLKSRLFPLVRVITPNLAECSLLVGYTVDSVEKMRAAAESLSKSFGCGVLVKGGHLSTEMMCDVLYDAGECYLFEHRRIDSKNTHGTGCTLSSAIAAILSHGYMLSDAVQIAKNYVAQAIAAAKDLKLGNGHGALWHF